MNENMNLYKQFATTPVEAKKTIGFGRLKGFTDINPMWRIKKLTEAFGPCGQGWKVEPRYWNENGANGLVFNFCEVKLFYKIGDEWSEPVYGIGGSMLIDLQKEKLYHNDEAHKMSYTDALGNAFKMLGGAADVFFEKDRTKYNVTPEPAPATISKQQIQRMFAIAKRIPVDDLKEIINSFGYSSSKDILLNDYDKIIKTIENLNKKGENENE